MIRNITIIGCVSLATVGIALEAEQAKATPLTRGFREERTLGPKDTYTYSVNLQNGEAIIAEAYQHGVDLVVDIVDPDGQQIRQVDSPNGIEGPEPIDLTALKSGTYKFIIHTLDENVAPGKYVMGVSAILSVSENIDRLAKKAYPVPAIFELYKASLSNVTAPEEFMAERKDKGPIVEPIPGNDWAKLVTFFYLGDQDTVGVLLGGAPFQATGFHKPMSRLGLTRFYYTSEIVPNDARFRYTFAVDKVHRAGPHGEVEVPESFETPETDLEMPNASPQPYFAERDNVAKGQSTRDAVTSKILNENRQITIYTPSGYSGKTPCNLLIMFDGEIYGGIPARTRFKVQTILDNMISDRKIGPTIAVMVWNMGLRDRDLTCNKPFSDFVSQELIPWVRSHYNISRGPGAVVAAGTSFGGLCSTFCGLEHPESIGNVLSLSGSYWVNKNWEYENSLYPYSPNTGSILERVRSSNRIPIRFFIEIGRFEPGGQLGTNRNLSDLLIAKGCELQYEEVNGGHNALQWRGAIGDGLIYLLGRTAK